MSIFATLARVGVGGPGRGTSRVEDMARHATRGLPEYRLNATVQAVFGAAPHDGGNAPASSPLDRPRRPGAGGMRWQGAAERGAAVDDRSLDHSGRSARALSRPRRPPPRPATSPTTRSSSSSATARPATRSSIRRAGRSRAPATRVTSSATRTTSSASWSSKGTADAGRDRGAISRRCTARTSRAVAAATTSLPRDGVQGRLHDRERSEPGDREAGDARRRPLLPRGAAARRRSSISARRSGVDNVDAYRLMIESFRWR